MVLWTQGARPLVVRLRKGPPAVVPIQFRGRPSRDRKVPGKMIHRLQRVYRHPNSDISLAELAAFVGVDRKTMRRWMNDDRW